MLLGRQVLTRTLPIASQYGAEMMESSVKTISRPVIDRLPVNQLDEFACRQLDRVRHIRSSLPVRARCSCFFLVWELQQKTNKS